MKIPSLMKSPVLILLVCFGTFIVTNEVYGTVIKLDYADAATAIDDGPQDGFFDSFAPDNYGSVNNNDYTSFRTALEFDISTIPAGSIINASTLTMLIDYIEGTREITLNGYVGDGTVQLGDFSLDRLVDKTSLNPPGSQIVTFDTTAFIESMITSSGRFAGFNVREDPANFSNYEVLFFNMTGPDRPQLSIDYTYIPEPSTIIFLVSGLAWLLKKNI